jgi:ribose transport system substrate-binding protein
VSPTPSAARRRGRVVLTAALAAAVAVGLAACAPRTPSAGAPAAGGQTGAPAAAQGPAKLALVAGGPNVFFDPWGESATTAKAQYQIPTVDYVVPPTQTFETAVQITTLNGLVSQGYNGLAVFPDGAEAIRPTYQRIAASGVSIVDITGCSKQPTAALFCVATDVRQAAYEQAKLVIAKMGGQGNLVFLAGEPTDPNTIQREDGINQAIGETNGAVKLLQVVAGIDSPAAATPAIQSLLAGSADQIDGIVSTSYYPSVAGAEIWQNNPQYRRIVFAAADNSPQVMQAIQSGAIYGSMFQDPLGQA